MPSVTGSISRAMDQVDRVLIHPFEARKWFVLGFCAFLAGLGEGGSINANGFRAFENAPSEIQEWVSAHMAIVLVMGACVLLVVVVLGLLFAWLSSRGTFMLLDGVVHDRAAVAEPWRRFRRQGNRLFVFSIQVGLSFLGVLLVLALAAGLVLYPLLRHGWNWVALAPILLFAVLFLALIAAMLLFWSVVRDFAVPVMYRLDLTPFQALLHLRNQVFQGHGWDVARFYLMKIVLSIGAGILVLAAGCLTCCIGFLPYLGSVLTLPVPVFFRCYALDFLAQVDPALELLPRRAAGDGPQP